MKHPQFLVLVYGDWFGEGQPGKITDLHKDQEP